MRSVSGGGGDVEPHTEIAISAAFVLCDTIALVAVCCVVRNHWMYLNAELQANVHSKIGMCMIATMTDECERGLDLDNSRIVR